MYIVPNTNVKILHNVPLDNTYDHTLYFANATAQYNYFAGQVKKNCVNYTYQRANKGVMRIEGKADNYYDCNYLMFQNTSFGTKWFYAFINNVEYVNNETTDVFYEIDVMQTWLFDAHVEECFIERQHSLSDAIGDNIIPEPLELGEYVMNDYAPVVNMVDMVVCLAIVDTDGHSFGNLYDGIYGSAQLLVYDSTDVTNIDAKIDEYAQKPDSIISMYMLPKALIGGTVPASHVLPYGQGGITTHVVAPAVTKQDTLNGYLPKNGKMYTYPYNFYHVDNASGSDLSLRYEFFENLRPSLEIGGTVTQPVAVILRPSRYKGVVSEQFENRTLNTESIQLNNYPMCSWNVDAFQAWIAQNSLPIVYDVMRTASWGMMLHPSTTMGTEDNCTRTGNLLMDIYRASIQADISKGNFNNGGVNTSLHTQQFYGGRCSVSYQFAKMIDDFFTMYGYAVKGIGRLNRSGRPHWNYVKTVGCVISGSVPAGDTRKIISIYDRGITFWRNANEVGNYELDNSLS